MHEPVKTTWFDSRETTRATYHVRRVVVLLEQQQQERHAALVGDA